MANIGKKTRDNETKKEKFIRLAEGRMNNILKNIDLLGNLSNKSNYDYEETDVEKMIKSLKSAVNNLEKIYGKKKGNGSFKF